MVHSVTRGLMWVFDFSSPMNNSFQERRLIWELIIHSNWKSKVNDFFMNHPEMTVAAVSHCQNY